MDKNNPQKHTLVSSAESQDTLFESDEISFSSKITYLDDDIQEPKISPETSTLIVENETSQLAGDVSGWWVTVIISIVVIALLDWSINLLGVQFFWSQQYLYIASLFVIFAIAIINCKLLLKRRQQLRNLLIINGLVGLLAGVILSISRFISNTSFWTLFNIIAQPINALILSLVATWFCYKIFNKQKKVSSESLETEATSELPKLE